MLLTAGGHRLAYDLLGPADGPVVAFAHSLASDGGMWAEQLAPLLAGGYRVLRIDMRGHGGSEAVPGEYTLDALADDLAGVFEARQIARAHLVGLSVGAMVGAAFAFRYADRLASLVLCDTQAASGPGARDAWSMPLAMVRQRGSVAPVATGLLRQWLSDAYKAAQPDRYEQIRQTALATSAVGFEGCVAAMSSYDHTAQLPSIGVPTLVVAGADDQFTKPAENRRVAELIPGARYEEIAGAKHFPNVEQPEAFNRVLLDWLKR
jgi:3-oxoadipate enol-lactonase